MNIYIGIGFVVLCLDVLVGIVSIFAYKLFFNKEKIELVPKDEAQSKNH